MTMTLSSEPRYLLTLAGLCCATLLLACAQDTSQPLDTGGKDAVSRDVVGRDAGLKVTALKLSFGSVERVLDTAYYGLT